MVKLVACDMDGTLVCKDGRLPSDFAMLLDAMRKKGVVFAVASGRPYRSLYEIFSPFGDDIVYISENGAYTRHNNEVILKRTFDIEDIPCFAAYFNCRSNGFLAACGLKCYYITSDVSEFLDSLSPFKIKYTIAEDFTKIRDDIFQLTVFFPNGACTSTDIPLYHEFEDKYDFTVTHTHWMDIHLKYINKGTGLEAVQRSLDIKPEETSAFGDFYNDIPMFQKARHSYCMGSAPDDVKSYARYIINSECGQSVTRAIKEIITDHHY